MQPAGRPELEDRPSASLRWRTSCRRSWALVTMLRQLVIFGRSAVAPDPLLAVERALAGNQGRSGQAASKIGAVIISRDRPPLYRSPASRHQTKQARHGRRRRPWQSAGTGRTGSECAHVAGVPKNGSIRSPTRLMPSSRRYPPCGEPYSRNGTYSRVWSLPVAVGSHPWSAVK